MKAGESNGIEIAGNDGNTTGTTITLADYGIDTATTGGILNLRLMADGKKVADYTINLSVRDPHTTASLNESATDGTGTYEVKVNNGAHDIDLVVPTGALAKGAHIRVQTQDNATIDTTNATNATVTDMKGGFYDIAVAKDGATITVISESGANKQAWTINVTEVDSLRTFSFGSYTGTVNTTDDEVTVTIPKKDGKDDMGYNVTFNLPVSFTTYGDTDKVYIGKQANGSDAVAYNVGTKLNVGALIANTNPSTPGKATSGLTARATRSSKSMISPLSWARITTPASPLPTSTIMKLPSTATRSLPTCPCGMRKTRIPTLTK